MIRIYLFFVAFVFFIHADLHAQNTVEFSGENVTIGKSISVLEDKSNSLTIQQVVSSKQFVPSNLKAVGLALSQSDFWLKFSITNKSQSDLVLLMIENPLLDKCDLFYENANHQYIKKGISDNAKFSNRKYKHQNAIFDLDIPIDSSQTFYLKVNSTEQMILPIVVGNQQNIAEYLINHDIIWGILIGLLGVMILYNLFLYISVKDISYLYYVLYTAFTLFTQITLSGYSFKFIFANSPLLFNKSVVIFPGLAGIFGVIFIQYFLQAAIKTPKLNRLFYVSIALYSAAIISKILGFDIVSYRLIDVAAIGTILLIYTIAISIAIQGYRPAKFFLLAWSVFFVGLILFIFKNIGILPYNFYTNYVMQIGTAVEVTLLSLALADRINILKKEKEASQAEALAAAKENERIITQQNIILEQKVEERTVELVKANTDLGDTLEDLKQAQSQLVESEKMASLGQLTAGIAHEINNPINFVTSNVPPLQRDVDMLFNALEFIESIGLSEKDTSAKRQSIEDYKEELDYDYLKIEIGHLLSGITDGANRTAEIVRGLRIFSRVDEDDLKTANINEGMDSTLTIMKNNITLSGIKVEKNYEKIPHIDCYPGKLNQVFLNLLSNSIDAFKLKDPATGEKIITISTSKEGDFVKIKIADNGVGMSEITKQKIFEPFFTTKEVGEGTGLGMSIVYNTIKKHNGEILVNSELNKGTEIILIIPISHEND